MMLHRQDAGWAWMVLLGSCISGFICGMLQYSGGLIHTVLQETYSDRVVLTSLTIALSTSLFAFAAPLASVVINITTCRTCSLFGGFLLLAGLCSSFIVKDLNVLLLTYGIMAGTGTCFCFIPSVVIIGYYFNKWSSLAFGVNQGAAGIGAFASNLITPYLLNTYGLQGTFLLYGAASGHVFVAAFLMRPCKDETRTSEKEVSLSMYKRLYDCFLNAKYVLLELCKNKSYIFHVISVTCFNISIAILVVHEPNYSIQLDIASQEQSAFLIAALSVASTLGRFTVGFSTSLNGLDDTIVYIGQLAIVGVLHLLFPLFDDTYKGHMVFCILSGFYLGGLLAQYQSINRKRVDLQMFASSTGPLLLFTGAGMLCGPALVGLMLEKGGTYRQGYIVSGVIVLVGALFALMSAMKTESRHQEAVNRGEGETQLMIPNKEETLM